MIKKSLILSLISFLVIFSFIFSPMSLAHEHENELETGTGRIITGREITDKQKNIFKDFASNSGFDTTLKTDKKSAAGTLGTITAALLGLVSAVATAFIIWGGYIWLTAGGNEEKVGTAKKYITNAVLGIIIGTLSYYIVNFLISLSAQ